MSLTKCPRDFCLPHLFNGTVPTDPTSSLYDVRPRGTLVRGNHIFHHISSIWYENSLVLHRSSITQETPTLGSPRRRSSLLNHRLSRGAVQRSQGPDTQSVEDYSAGCNVLFPVHIHFTFRAHDVSLFRKRKHIVIIYHLYITRSYLYRIRSSYSLPRK